MPARAIVDDIFQLFDQRGHRHYGESVTELQHALQAATFAEQFGEAPHVVAAALLHDYGHLMHDLGEDVADQGIDARHEDLGADRLSTWFAEEVVEPVRLHVTAKRYLCGKQKAYLDGLSPASRQSLALQGGPMTEDELRQFEQHPHYDSAVRLRRYDDMGKVPDMETPGLEHFRPVLERFLRG